MIRPNLSKHSSFLSLLCLFAFAFLVAVSAGAVTRPTSTTPPKEDLAGKKKWTFMVFMAADNNLEGGTETDINEMETIGTTKDMAIMLQVDRIGKFSQNSDWKWSGTKRFIVKRDNDSKKVSSPVAQDLGEVDSADPQVLLDFVRWSAKTCPAEHYALILWNHGTGWKEIQPDVISTIVAPVSSVVMPDEIPVSGLSPELSEAMSNISYNISYDNTSGTSMDIPTLGSTMGKIAGILGKPVDLLGFDACLMQMVEVAHAIAPYARFQVGSTDLEPERGWPYDSILKGLAANPAMDGRKLGDQIVNTYKTSYQMGSQGNVAITLSLIDLSKIKEFAQTLKSFSDEIRKGINEIDKIEQARDEALKYVYKDYVDLGNFLKLLAAKTGRAGVRHSAEAVLEALSGISGQSGLVANNAFTGEKYKDSRGISIFFPDRGGFKTYKKPYSALSWAREGGWIEFLDEFETPSLPYLKIQEVVLVDQNQDGRIAPGESVKVRAKIRNFGKKTTSKVSLTAQTTSDLLDKKNYATALANSPAPGSEAVVELFSFTVAPQVPENSEVTLQFSLTGEGVPASTYRSTFFIKAPFATIGHVLLVLTDGFSPASPVLQDMFQQGKVKFDVWDRMLDGDLKPEVLKRYIDGWVFVSVQDSSDRQQLTAGEIEALTGFLKTGGKIALSGQDLAFSLRDNPFLKSMVRASFVQDDINVHVVSGVSGFAKDATFQIYGGDGANNQKWPDEIDSLAGAKVLMKYNEGARDIADDKDMIGPDLKPGSPSRGVKSSGGAAVSVNDGYRLAFFAFGIEAINSAPQRQSIIAQIQSFMNPTLETQVNDFADASRRRAASRPRTARERLDQIDLLSSIENRLTSKIKRRMENDPSFASRIQETIENLPTESRKSINGLEKNVRSLLEFDRQHGTVNQR